MTRRPLTDHAYRVAWDQDDITFTARLATNPDGSLTRWNGFVCPFLARTEIDRYAAWVAEHPEAEYDLPAWDGDTLILTQPYYAATEPDYQPDRIPPIDGLYPMGAWAWTWTIVPPDTDPDDEPAED